MQFEAHSHSDRRQDTQQTPQSVENLSDEGGLSQPFTELFKVKYELLSSYLDRETTASERSQVEQWLAEDPELAIAYRQLLHLRSQWQAMPTPTSNLSPQAFANRVFHQINRRTQRTLIWSGTAIAALFMAALSGLVFENPARVSLFAQQEAESEPLKIALNEPIVPLINQDDLSISVDQPIFEIPKAPLSGTFVE
ncbi:MAG: anti-sigma factor family protein [Microcoleaceae cyanobacterium]